ncbi:hypothetical protein H6503_04435 [Candidatus Woesearchaeota archaeon]|nr:hypothetical protein [Candidatus Woesearchaeota archaeon]
MDPASLTNITGLTAGIIVTIALIPQLINIIRKNKVDDISEITYILLTIGFFIWVIYGVMRQNLAIIFMDGITFMLAFAITVSVLRLRDKSKKYK